MGTQVQEPEGKLIESFTSGLSATDVFPRGVKDMFGPHEMTQGNWDMVGRLCLEVAKLRAKWGEQQAKLDAQGRRIAELDNRVAQLESALRRQTDSPQRHGDGERG